MGKGVVGGYEPTASSRRVLISTFRLFNHGTNYEKVAL